MHFARQAAQTIESLGRFASLSSVQRAAPLAPLCGYPDEVRSKLGKKLNFYAKAGRNSSLSLTPKQGRGHLKICGGENKECNRHLSQRLVKGKRK